MTCHSLNGLSRAAAPLVGAKARGLAQLQLTQIPVPDAIILDAQEFAFFQQHNELSHEAVATVQSFVQRQAEAGCLPLVSIRCEAKSLHGNYKQLGVPHSLLNVGVRHLSRNDIREFGIDDPDGFWRSLNDHYDRRLEQLVGQSLAGMMTGATIAEEIVTLIRLVYQRFLSFAPVDGANSFPTSLIVQQMVYGNWNRRSGNGFCCTVNPHTRVDDDFGVFLPCQQGFGLVKGQWGDSERAFADVRALNPAAYSELKRILRQLNQQFGEYQYIEYTIQDCQVFVLDHTNRVVKHPVPVSTI
jgi:hypothetical protein